MSYNKQGFNTVIYYQEERGLNRIAKLQETYITFDAGGIIQNAYDPHWLVQIPGTGDWNGPHQWLTYFGTDNNIWKSETHSSVEQPGDRIKLFFKSIRKADGGGQNPTMRIVDWDGTKWNIDNLVVGPAPSGQRHAVGFNLSQVF